MATGWIERMRERCRRGPLVTVVGLSGVIGRAGMGRQGLTLDGLDAAIEKAFKPGKLAAVALAINSPGGSPVQSALIARRIRALADEKNVPVLAFCEDVAASGGYWLALAGDEIHADAASIVGSIGVIYGGFGFTGLLEKAGVERRVHTAGNRKMMLDPFAPEKRDDVRHLKTLQDDIHREFCAWVRERRGDRLRGDERDLFSGAFWTGNQALELGLVDRLGGLHDVLRARFGKTVRIKRVNAGGGGLVRRLLGLGARPDLAERIVGAVEDRLYWNRFGL
ncbi:MAG: S49 family peptidase [Alphaproteobacteria bacterium]|nr:S49 family peptidase [Alphaproteobacteria bacterium]MBF0251107.1 S49 family peptidase [Alphaproteobacteria bacterium]